MASVPLAPGPPIQAAARSPGGMCLQRLVFLATDPGGELAEAECWGLLVRSPVLRMLVARTTPEPAGAGV